MAIYNTLVSSFDKFLRAIDPLLRLPFIFTLDTRIGAMNFDNMDTWSWIWVVSAVFVGVPLFFLLTHENVRFLYGCSILVHVLIPILSLSVGPFVPVLQNIFNLNSSLIVADGLRYYLFTFVVLELTKMNYQVIPKPFSLTIPLALSRMYIWHYKYSWLVGYLFYFLGEFLDVHILIHKAFIEATNIVKLVGPFNAAIFYWRQKKVSMILRLFWLSTVFSILLYLQVDQLNLEWVFLAAAASCNSRLRLVGMSLWIPEVSYAVLWTTKGFLGWTISHTALDLERRDLSKAVIFYFIASVNNVTNIEVIDRIFVISILMYVSFSYLFSSVYTLIDQALKSLSTSMQARAAAHIRALMLMLFLIWLLVYTSYKFCMLFPLRFWQLVVVSSNIVTALQATSSLAIYSLFMYESKVLSDGVDDVDEWVYRITAFANSCEFLAAVLVLGFAVFDVIKGNWSVVGLLIIVFHTYYNLWLKAREGWKIFLARRSAVNKLNRLTDATKEQLDELKDLCPICFDSMEVAKITKCGHYFHEKCLRKWLYIQTTCPLCHQDVVMTTED